MNQHEKIFHKTLQFYQNEIRKQGSDFYYFRPADIAEGRRYSTTVKPCDFWFFDEAFVALELKYTSSDRIRQSQIKEHQMRSLEHFFRYKSRSFLILTLKFNPNLTIRNSPTFAVPIRDASNWFEKSKRSFFLGEEKEWKGYRLEWKNQLKIFNIDPIVTPKFRLFK